MKILIVKTSSLGDIIHAFPALAFIRKKCPDAEIHWVVEKPFAELVQAHPFVDKVITIDTRELRTGLVEAAKGFLRFRKEMRRESYDVVFDFQCNIKSGLIVSQVRSKNKVGFGWKTAIEWPNCFFSHIKFNPPVDCNVRDENLFLVRGYFRDHMYFEDPRVLLKITPEDKIQLNALLSQAMFQTKVAMICPGSAWRNKQVTPEAMVSFLDKLHYRLDFSFVFLWGNQVEKDYVEQLAQKFPECSKVLPRMSLPLLQNFMNHMELVVAMDSLPLHLAGTTAVRTFGVFGASSAQKFMPYPNHMAHQGDCPYGRQITRRCPVIRTCPTGACVRGLSGDDLYSSYIRQV